MLSGAFRKKMYRSIKNLLVDVDRWLQEYSKCRSHQGHWYYGKTLMQPLLYYSVPLAKEKILAADAAEDSLSVS